MKQVVIYDSKGIIKDICYMEDNYMPSSELEYGIYRICIKEAKLDRKTKKAIKKAILMKIERRLGVCVQIKTHYINRGTLQEEFYRKPKIQVYGGQLKFYKKFK